MTERLTSRALNRATLARQWLLEREKRPALDVIEHLVGMQAQAPFPPYFGLWSRLDGFDAAHLSSLLQERTVVRIVVMRGTVHLVSARDALTLRPLMQSVIDRELRSIPTRVKALGDVDLRKVAEVGRKLLVNNPLTLQELRPLLSQEFPGYDAEALVYAMRVLLPLVQVPPRGVWGRSGQPRLADVQEWLGQSHRHEASIDDVVMRYLNAFGPASVSDVQTWCGLKKLREVLERLRTRLVTFCDESGVELFDLPTAPRPAEDMSAPARLLAAFDNVLLSYNDRTRIMGDDVRRRVFASKNGLIPGTMLVDGFVVGVWRWMRKGKTAIIALEPFAPLSKKAVRELEAEAQRLLDLAAPDVDVREVTWGA
jgi:hypothetical protein